MTLSKRWISTPPIAPEIDQALDRFPPLQRRLLAQRGVGNDDQADLFLTRRAAHPTDPFALRDMRAAVDRIMAAIQRGETIAVFGDYDADGVTATALLTGALESLGATVIWHVPDRFQEGYGLNRNALGSLHEAGARVVITVDCGIRSHQQTRFANELGLDVIITDHHLPDTALPPALAVIDPKRRDDSYPFDGFAGVGLSFKLVEALFAKAGRDDAAEMADLVAIGTIADLAPLKGENRALVWQGLQYLNGNTRMGVLALMRMAGYRQGTIDAGSVGFGIAPRINAAGRMQHAGHAVELMLSMDEFRANELAIQLNDLNHSRRQITGENLDLARKQSLPEGELPPLLMASHQEFHEGVVGLAASRLVDEYYRPAVLIKEYQDLHKGSARSIPEFHITEALDLCSDLLAKHGGHASAAGFSLPPENLEAFSRRMRDIAQGRLHGQDLRPRLEIDAYVEFPDLTEELMEFLDRLQPCGEGNPAPVFATRGAQVLSKRVVGAEGRHLKLSLRQGNRVFDAIAFRQADRYDSLQESADVAFRFERNEYQGIQSLQLNVRDIRPS